VAANRLMKALNSYGVSASMLVRDGNSEHANVGVLKCQWLARWYFLWERLMIFMHLHGNKKHLFEIDTASIGADITRYKVFREADIIHLHWTNQGMLSLKGLRRILQSGKPVVWTMHDLWAASGICHVALGCRRFVEGCHHCQLLPEGGSLNDLSARVYKRKQRLLSEQSITFVACSRWLESEAKSSALMRGQRVTSIPNPIDTRVYHPTDKAEARQREQLPQDMRLLLFVCQRVTNPNKGMQYLVDACSLLARQHPTMQEEMGVVILGGHAEEVADQLPFKTFALGYVSDEQRLVDIYNAVDLFVLPSLSENLPNTIMEAMACGVPCLGFRVGGIPEMIDHRRTGYVAEYCSSDDLARGIRWVLCEAPYEALKRQALSKVEHSYSLSSVAMRYSEVYQQAIAQKHFML